MAWSLVVAAALAVAPVADEPPDEPGPDIEAEAASVPEPESEPEAEPDADVEPDALAENNGFGDALLEEALERFLEGGELFEDRRYLDAAAAYERSYAAVAVGKTLYNIGLSYEKGGNIVQALEAYLRYLELPDCPAPQEHCADRRDEVKETVNKLRAKVGTLSIVIDDGVDLQGIEVEDRFIPPEDFPLVLTPGRYELRVRGARRSEVRTRQVEIAAGQITSLLIPPFDAPDPTLEEDLDPPERDTGAPPPSRLDEEERRRRLRAAFYGGVGVTALAGVATGVVGGLTLQSYRTYEGRCTGGADECLGTDFPADAERRFYQLKPATNALIGVTAAAGITTVVLGLFAFSGKTGAGARASVTRITPAPGGLRMRF